MQKGECNLNKPYYIVLNMSSLSVLTLPYHVFCISSLKGPRAHSSPRIDLNEARCECPDAFM